jgi:hypothetical protein
MKRKFAIVLLAACIGLPAQVSAMGPIGDPFGWFMRVLGIDAGNERQALITQYRRSQSRAIEPEPTISPSYAFDLLGLRRHPRAAKWQPPRRNRPRFTVGGCCRRKGAEPPPGEPR